MEQENNNNYDEILDQVELLKLRQGIVFEFILGRLKDESIRNELSTGSNGNCKLEENDFHLLDSFYAKSIPAHVRPWVKSKREVMMSLLVDGSPEIFDGNFTYGDIKTVLEKIQKSPLFEDLDSVLQPKYQGIPAEVAERIRLWSIPKIPLPTVSATDTNQTVSANNDWLHEPILPDGTPHPAFREAMRKMQRETDERIKRNKPKKRTLEERFESMVERRIERLFMRNAEEKRLAKKQMFE